MKKKIFAIALTLTALVAMPSIAKTPKAEKQKTEQTDCKDTCKKDKKCDDKCAGKVDGKKCDKKKSDKKCDGKKKCHGKKAEGCKHDGKFKHGDKNAMRHCKAEGPKGLQAALKGIDLTDAQKEQIKTLRQECRAEMDKNREAARENMCTMMDSKLAEILTPAQMEQFKTNRVKIESRCDKVGGKVEQCKERKMAPRMECGAKCEAPVANGVNK